MWKRKKIIKMKWMKHGLWIIRAHLTAFEMFNGFLKIQNSKDTFLAKTHSNGEDFLHVKKFSAISEAFPH